MPSSSIQRTVRRRHWITATSAGYEKISNSSYRALRRYLTVNSARHISAAIFCRIGTSAPVPASHDARSLRNGFQIEHGCQKIPYCEFSATLFGRYCCRIRSTAPSTAGVDARASTQTASSINTAVRRNLRMNSA